MLLKVKRSKAPEDLLEAIGKQDLGKGKGAVCRRLGHEGRCGDCGGPFGGRRRIEREVTSPNSKANPVPLQLATITIQALKEDWQGLLWHKRIL